MRPIKFYLERDKTITPMEISLVRDIVERLITKLRTKSEYEEDEERKIRMFGVISELEKVAQKLGEGNIPKARYFCLGSLTFTDVRDMLYAVSPSMDSKIALDKVLHFDAMKFKKPPKRVNIMESKNKRTVVSEDGGGGGGGGGGAGGGAGGAGGASGSVGTGAVAAYPNRMFKRPKMLRRRKAVGNVPAIQYHNESTSSHNLKESFMRKLLTEFAPGVNKFNPSDVHSKLDASEKRLDFQRNSVPFGLKDETGQIVVVYVRPDQADDFENVVAAELNRTDSTPSEIAELLFNLRGRFDILHAEWPNIPEDAEEPAGGATAGVPGAAGGAPGAAPGAEGAPGGQPGADAGALPNLGGDAGGAPGGDMSGMGDMGMGAPGGEGEAGSALDKVIDMLKADIEARKAEADARKAQANADEAKYAAQIANDKIRSEQEVMDAKGYYDTRKKDENEAKKLMLLAKYRTDAAREAEDGRAQGTF
jgi:hypothetical protein